MLKFRPTSLGRLIRDIERKVTEASQGLLNSVALAKRLHAQQPKGKKKMYSCHAREVNFFGEGEAHALDEVGAKATIATILNEGLAIEMRTLPGDS